MEQQSTLTSKLLNLLDKSNRKNNIGFFLLTIEEYTPKEQIVKIFDKCWYSLKLNSINNPWQWLHKIQNLEEMHKVGKHFGSLQWREEEKINKTTIIKFYNLIMVESDYFASNEYKHNFKSINDENRVTLYEKSRELSEMFLLSLEVTCVKLPIETFGEELVEDILEKVGYFSHRGNRKYRNKVKLYNILPSWDFRNYRKLGLDTLPNSIKDSIQITLFILAIAGFAAYGIDLGVKISLTNLTKQGFDPKELAYVFQVTQNISLYILYFTLLGLTALLAILAIILLKEKRSNLIMTLAGFLSLAMFIGLFAFLIFITPYSIFKNELTSLRITAITFLICYCIYFVFFVENELKISRYLSSIIRVIYKIYKYLRSLSN